MGENAEFEKLATLEARLAAALDRISVGLGEVQAAPEPLLDPGITSGAFEDAQMRAEQAEGRVAALEVRIAELEAAAPAGDDAVKIEAERDAALARIEALEAAREADHDESHRALAARDHEIEALKARLEEAEAALAPAADAEEDGELERLRAQVSELEAKVARLRAERDEAFVERDEARDIAEEMQAASGVSPDDRMMALRAEIHEMRAMNERLTKNLARLRGENAQDPTVLNKALLVELDALKVARASEAAELERILADLDGAEAGEVGHA